MREQDCLVFVEVRYRSANRFANAAMTVDSKKQLKLVRTAELFIASHANLAAGGSRFDVVGIDRERDGQTRVEWLRDAFLP